MKCFRGREESLIRGQSLLEVLIAVALSVLMMVAASSVLVPLIRTNTSLERLQTSASLGKELLENVRSISEANWHALHDLPRGSSNSYYVNASISPLTVASGIETVVVQGISYERYFYIDDVVRDLGGYVDESLLGVPDPSTLKITVIYRQFGVSAGGPGIQGQKIIQYLFRSYNKTFHQTDWSGGPGVLGPLTIPGNAFDTATSIDFSTSTGSIVISGF